MNTKEFMTTLASTAGKEGRAWWVWSDGRLRQDVEGGTPRCPVAAVIESETGIVIDESDLVAKGPEALGMTRRNVEALMAAGDDEDEDEGIRDAMLGATCPAWESHEGPEDRVA